MFTRRAPSPAWILVVRAILAAMWLVHGLEKFGVRWNPWLNGGTHSVAGMLGMMADETPVPMLDALIDRLLLPLGGLLQYPVGILEVALGLAIASGYLLRWAAPVGALMQVFFWLGFLTFDWPYQYPLVIAAHMALTGHAWLWRSDLGLSLLRAVCGIVWIASSTPLLVALGVLILGGLGSRVLSLAALPLAVTAMRAESWGYWPWSYYLVACLHIAVLLGNRGDGLALSRLLPERLRRLAA